MSERETFKDDGTPDLRPWADELDQDYACILHQVRVMLLYDDPPTATHFAVMRKEARRMESDIERMAKHAGFSREDLDREPL